jgi:CRISPR/Cas system-associated exonuclease Cas4 (RecB family)
VENRDLGFKTLDDLFDRESEDLKKEVIQMLLYSWILRKTVASGKNVQPLIYPVLNLNDDSFDFHIRMQNKAVQITELESAIEFGIKNLISEMYDENVVFRQTEFTERCRTCPYREICRK